MKMMRMMMTIGRPRLNLHENNELRIPTMTRRRMTKMTRTMKTMRRMRMKRKVSLIGQYGYP